LLTCIFRDLKQETMFNTTEQNQDINIFFAESTMTGHSRVEYIINSSTVQLVLEVFILSLKSLRFTQSVTQPL